MRGRVIAGVFFLLATLVQAESGVKSGGLLSRLTRYLNYEMQEVEEISALKADLAKAHQSEKALNLMQILDLILEKGDIGLLDQMDLNDIRLSVQERLVQQQNPSYQLPTLDKIGAAKLKQLQLACSMGSVAQAERIAQDLQGRIGATDPLLIQMLHLLYAGGKNWPKLISMVERVGFEFVHRDVKYSYFIAQRHSDPNGKALEVLKLLLEEGPQVEYFELGDLAYGILDSYSPIKKEHQPMFCKLIRTYSPSSAEAALMLGQFIIGLKNEELASSFSYPFQIHSSVLLRNYKTMEEHSVSLEFKSEQALMRLREMLLVHIHNKYYTKELPLNIRRWTLQTLDEIKESEYIPCYYSLTLLAGLAESSGDPLLMEYFSRRVYEKEQDLTNQHSLIRSLLWQKKMAEAEKIIDKIPANSDAMNLSKAIAYNTCHAYDKDFRVMEKIKNEKLKLENIDLYVSCSLFSQHRERCLELSKKVNTQDQGANLCFNIAMSHFLRGEAKKAYSSFTQYMLKRQDDGYGWLFVHLTEKELNREYRTSPFRKGIESNFSLKILDYLEAKISLEQLLAFAEKEKDEKLRREHYSEAHFYIGETYRLSQDLERAYFHYQQSIKQECVDFYEDMASRCRLEQLNPTSPVSSGNSLPSFF